MRELQFTVPEGYNGVRLKGFLRGYCSVSARLLTALKKEPHGITVNDTRATVLETLHMGDVVKLRLPEDRKELPPAEIPLRLLYEDADLLVVDKPAGMPVHPSPGHDRDSLANAVAAYFQGKGERVSIRPVYRLDKDTTGVMLLAKNAFAAARLAKGVHKVYFAVCEGVLHGNATEIGPIGLCPGHSIQRAIVPDGVPAMTHWKAISNSETHTLLKVRIETGRTHQIRVHMAHLQHPLAGDDMYGGSLERIQRQALHCGEIAFCHPVTGEKYRLFAPLPEDMRRLLVDFCPQDAQAFFGKSI
ncbi:RluA family pseudouridine synthase [Clostridium sp. D33t1_170424_F3]|uniref:RluA family pseudouridine synthase n=1 Tax=Clostridium sp. D33t1_170424_F3 TaxID=2787099 RepID=UPI0018A89324|nr:RluA family pseudouridine synthase [Clostridium sp. D33t1_170424_F3]